MQAENYSLVADIGGTNARFALVADGGDGVPIEPRNLICAEYPTLIDAALAGLGVCGLAGDRRLPRDDQSQLELQRG